MDWDSHLKTPTAFELQDVDPANRELLYVAFDILYVDGQVSNHPIQALLIT